ncbi:MAG: RNA polymerase sigma-70 factor [Prolixibacteraceae bacterium]|nr:RNA polymerase sigma-70 factor [Prolixibacteraceae bacterium]
MIHRQPKYSLNLNGFELFFKDSYQAACLVAYRFIDEKSVVEDIVQESYITLWKKYAEIYQTDEELKKYLLVTVRNRAVSYLRSIKLRHVDIEKSLQEMNLSDDEKLYDEEELSIRVAQAIKQLPARCREVFLLAYSENKTYGEIARQLSISKNTVKTQMAIAYRILREELKEFYFGFLLFVHRKKMH